MFARCIVERPSLLPAGASDAAWLASRAEQRRTASLGGPLNAPVLVEVEGLSRRFDVSRPWLNRILAWEPKRYLKAVQGVQFTIKRGQTLALVGESGSGKSTVARMVVGLLPPSAGTIRIDGVALTGRQRRAAVRRLRRRMQMIFQDPLRQPQPRAGRVDRIIAEPLRAFGLVSSSEAQRERVTELLPPGRARPRATAAKFPARVFGRAASTHLDRQGTRFQPRVPRVRRADLGTRRVGPGADPEPDARPARRARPHLPVHQPQSRRRPAHGRPDRRAVRRSLGRNGAPPARFSPDHCIPTLACCSRRSRTLRCRERAERSSRGEIPSPIDPPRGCPFHPRCPLRGSTLPARVAAAHGDRPIECRLSRGGRKPFTLGSSLTRRRPP